MTDTRNQLSDTKRALLEKLLAGKRLPPAELTEVRHHPADEPSVLSFAQERLWFLNQLDPLTTAYNMHDALHLSGTLNIDALEKAINIVIGRHEILRTVFVADNGRITQSILPEFRLKIDRSDLSDLPQSEQDVEVKRRTLEAAQYPFDLLRGPLLYVAVLRLATDDHVLLITMHHIISDERSNQLFWHEMATAYAAEVAGSPLNLPQLPIQYADFAYGQRRWLNESLIQKQLAYWKEQLAGDLPLIQLPTDHPRPAVQSYKGAMSAISLPTTSLQTLDRFSQQTGTTPFMVVMAVFHALLQRYTGQGNISVGTPIANRNRPEIETLIGFFLNTLVMRADLSGNPRFTDLVAQVRETALNAYANADLPFDSLVDELRPVRDLSFNPLFQVMLVYQEEAGGNYTLPGITSRMIPVDGRVSKFDLTLFVTRAPDSLQIALEYATDLFEAATIDRMLGHFGVLFNSALNNPDQRVSELALLTDEERHQLLVEWNDTKSDYTRERCLHYLIEDIVDKTPNAQAVVYQGQSLSYAQLEGRSNQLAHRLIELDVQPGDRVALCVERSLEMLVGIVGIFKAGAAYVPLDPAYPPDRLAFMLVDSAASAVVTQRHINGVLPNTQAKRIELDVSWSQISSQPNTRPTVTITSDHLAYVIYTSGSTGKPKGVPITHRNLVHSTTARFRFYPEPVKKFLLLSSFAFDSSVVGLFWTLCQGGTLVLPRQKQEQDIYGIASLVAEHGITHILCLPSLYHILLEHGQESLHSLKTVMVAGEACTADLVHDHYRLLPHATLYNEYGPTEGTVWSSAYAIPADFAGTVVPIGKPIPNMQAYVLDSYLQTVPIGVAGELYIGGEGLTEGYLNRPELTAQNFLPNPFLPGERLYRTGDLVRWLPDGQLAFLGRVDHQVKIRGHRVELEEIEAALLNQPDIAQAVVIAESDTPSSIELDNLEAVAAALTTAGEGGLRLLSAIEVQNQYLSKASVYES